MRAPLIKSSLLEKMHQRLTAIPNELPWFIDFTLQRKHGMVNTFLLATLSTAILMMGNRGEATRAVLMTTWAKKRLPIKPDHQKSNGCWSNINSAASTGDDIGCCYYCGLQGLLGKNLITFRSDSVVLPWATHNAFLSSASAVSASQ